MGEAIPRNREEEPKRGADWRRELFPTRGALWIALLVCVLAPTALVAMQISANPGFSPLDEPAHFDYVERVARGEIPRQGQRLLKSTLQEIACRGVGSEGPKAMPCTPRDLGEGEVPGGASQYEAQQPPTYYAVTVPLRWVARELFRIRDNLDAARATGILWLVGGLLLTWAAGRVMGIEPLPLGAALLLLSTAPIVVYGTATVSNDVTAVPAAGLVALVAALAYRRDGPRVPIALLAAGFVAAACRATNLFPVVAVSALFAVGAVTRRQRDEPPTSTVRRWSRDGGALLLGGAIATVIWVFAHRSLSLIELRDEPAFGVLRSGPRTVGPLLREATDLFQPLTGSFVSPDTLGQPVQAPLHTALSFLVIGGALAGLFVSGRQWSHALGLVLMPVLYVGGVLLGVSLMITYEIAPGLSGRYGMSLAPLLVIVLAASLTGKWSQRAVAAFAATLFLTTLVVMVI
jgi:hypothetical protein